MCALSAEVHCDALALLKNPGEGLQQTLDDRQITHLICVRLKHLLYDFLGGVLGLLPVVFLVKKALNTP